MFAALWSASGYDRRGGALFALFRRPTSTPTVPAIPKGQTGDV
jgi:hypothetical protein